MDTLVHEGDTLTVFGQLGRIEKRGPASVVWIGDRRVILVPALYSGLHRYRGLVAVHGWNVTKIVRKNRKEVIRFHR